MNIRAKPAEAPIAVPHPTLVDTWTVTLDGASRTITREGSGFIAWIGHQSRQWTLKRATKACVDDLEHQQFLERQRYVNSIAIGVSDEERWLIQFSDADNAAERAALMRSQQEI